MTHTTVASQLFAVNESGTFALDLMSGRRIESAPPALILDPAESWQKNLQRLQEHATVGVWFSKSVDGRGLSLAARIRETWHDIELHAVGAVHADMIYFLKRCGFDVCHLPQVAQTLIDSETLTIGRELLRPFSRHYQTGADGESGLVGTASVRRYAVLRSA